MEKKLYAKDLINYLDNAQTPYQSVDFFADMLTKNGAQELKITEKWNIEKGKKYFVINEGTQIVAFRIGEKSPLEAGFRIAAAHHDTPGFRIKPVASRINKGYEEIHLEPYGGLINRTWLDRPLGVAGRIVVKDGDGFKAMNICIGRPVMIIPSPAAHIVRDQNQKATISVQNNMLPILAISADGKLRFKEMLANEVGVNENDILSFELSPFETFGGCLAGLNEEFISSARIDDAAMAYTIFRGLCDTEKCEQSVIAMAYNHEEIGSQTGSGAYGNFLNMIFDRIYASLGYGAEERYISDAKSILLSADVAHATHPQYASLYDTTYFVKMGGGPVLKWANYQSYVTTGEGSAYFITLCEKAGIPHQTYVNNSDMRTGSTVGPIVASKYSIMTIDIGLPQLAMHAQREMCGTDDIYYTAKLFKYHFGE